MQHPGSYAQAIEQLTARGLELVTAPGAPRRKFDLGHMRTLVAALGNPQQQFTSVLIAGTNGKGSTAATLAAILAAAGHRTGLYTSPHLVRVNERIQLADPAALSHTTGPLLAPVPDEEFARCYFLVEETAEKLVATGQLPQLPSYFESITAVAFCCFAARRVEIAVLEVGMGGRLDATNVVEPVLSIITDISLDHTEWLGKSIAEITREKAGILRSDGLLVTLPQHPEANQSIGECAAELNVTGISAGDFIPQRAVTFESPMVTITTAASPAGSITPQQFRNRYRLALADPALGDAEIKVDSPLAGVHQQRNLALAIAAAQTLRRNGFRITPGDFELGIRRTHWPARLELLPQTNSAPVLLDVAHNPAGAWALRSAISSLPETPRTLLFGCLADKPIAEMMQILFPLFDGDQNKILLTPPDSQRAASLDALIATAATLGFDAEAIPDAHDALTRAQSITPRDGLIVATGSLYLVGALRGLLLPPPLQ